MGSSDKQTTVLSTKGQVILPQAIRKQRQWVAGTRLTVENTPDGVLLRPVPDFPTTKPADVFGCLAFAGKPKTLVDMEKGILSEARRRYARD
jgi:AbrB family looped-hinge helix DNA binding protein